MVWFDKTPLPTHLGCSISARSLAPLTKNNGQRVSGAARWDRASTLPRSTNPSSSREPLCCSETNLPLAGKNARFKFHLFVDPPRLLLFPKRRKFRVSKFFCSLIFYIYIYLFFIYIYTQTYTRTKPRQNRVTCVQD